MSSSPAIDDEKFSSTARNDSADAEDASSIAAGDKDIAIAIVGEHSHMIDPAAEARVVRKIDWFLVPAMSIGYGLVYYDKVNISVRYCRHLLIFQGDLRIRSSLRNDHRPRPHPTRLQHDTHLAGYLPS